MQQEPIQTLIIGGGVAGLACAWHLGQTPDVDATRVALVERETLCGSQSSALNAAILRTFSGDPITSAIARRAAVFLRNPPEGFAPHALLNPCGLILGASGAAADQMRQALAQAGTEAGARELSKAEVERLAPHLLASSDIHLLFENEGQLDISAEIDGFLRGARRAGVRIQTGVGVKRLLNTAGRVTGAQLEDGSMIHAETTVIAAGGWADALGQSVGSTVRMQATRRHLMVSARDAQIDPSWPIVWLDDAGFYCRPESGGLLVSACDLSDTHPDRCHKDPSVLESFATKVAEHTPRFAGARVAHYWCGMRTLSRDERFQIGPDPELKGLFWAAALGGHGMSCAPEVGRLVSVLLNGKQAAEDPAILAAIAPGRAYSTSNPPDAQPLQSAAPRR